jgi:hypothetical protein
MIDQNFDDGVFFCLLPLFLQLKSTMEIITIESSDAPKGSDCSESTTWLQTMVWIGEWDDEPDDPRNGFWPRADDCTGDSDGALSADSWFQQRSKYIPSQR